MNLASLIVSDVTDVFLNTDDFAETVKRRVEDWNNNRPQNVTALVTWEIPNRNSTEGARDFTYRGSLQIPDSLSPGLKMSDRWEINGVNYATIAISPPQSGMQSVMVEKRTGDIRGGSLGVL